MELLVLGGKRGNEITIEYSKKKLLKKLIVILDIN